MPGQREKLAAQRKRPDLSLEAREARLIIVVASLVAAAVLGAFFWLTGLDPFGLFNPPQVTPTPVAREWWHVYFTAPGTVNDPNNLRGSIPEIMIGNINKAQRSIHIAAYEFDLTPVAEALIAAQQRGVEVQWVTDDENGLEVDGDKGRGQFAMLRKAGIPVKDDGRGALMHNKFIVFDGRTVWTGSANPTRNDNFRNNNNVLILDAPEVAAIYEREFAELWAGKFGPTSPSTLDRQQVTLQGTPIQVLFASEDEVMSHLIPRIQAAGQRIRFMAFSFTHDELEAVLLARARAGVDVQGIFEARGSELEFSALRGLYCAGLAVRQDGNRGVLHHKVIVVDDKLVITGSLNFTASGDESNDENVVVLSNPEIAAMYLQEFERRWAEATQPKAGDMKCK
jgi:phosphatidylserine/phosphatidylglycerophosphate/cardiolipin synthase-like enzyme